MKRTVLVLAAVCLLMQANAQKISIGAKAGVNLHTMKISTPDGSLTGGNTGFHAGATSHIVVGKNVAVQPGLVFAMKSAELENFKFQSYHVELPLNLVYTHDRFFIGGGPNISYAVSGTVKADGNKADMFDAAEAFTLTHKRLDVGANVVMGYNFPGGLQVSSFYTGGLSDIYKGDGEVQGIETKTRNFGITIGYLWPLGKK